MAQNKPLVSVIVIVYDRGKNLTEAMRSVSDQTYRPVEIIVINGGRIQEGIDLAAGQYLAFLAADDLWSANKLALQMSMFDDDPDLDVVLGHMPQAMLIKREAFARLGLSEADNLAAQALYWGLKARELKLKSSQVPQPLVKKKA